MTETRRRMLTTFLGHRRSLARGTSAQLAARGWTLRSSLFPYPNGRGPQCSSGNWNDPTTIDRKAIEMEHRKELRADVAKLYDMVVELKEQVDKMDANSTFSNSRDQEDRNRSRN